MLHRVVCVAIALFAGTTPLVRAEHVKNTSVFVAEGPGAARCYRLPTLLSTGKTLIAFAEHRWDAPHGVCQDWGLKAIAFRTSVDGTHWSQVSGVLLCGVGTYLVLVLT